MAQPYLTLNTLDSIGPWRRRWIRFWTRFAGTGTIPRLCAALAAWQAPPHKAAGFLAGLHPRGFIYPSARIYHADLHLGRHTLIGDRVLIYQNRDGGRITLEDRVTVLRDCALESGYGGTLTVGAETWIQPRCQLNAYVGSIRIGRGVDIAPNCALYSYDHGFAPGQPIRKQSLVSKGDLIIGDHAWLGCGVIVLSGVTIGEGAVVGAGSLVVQDIPAEAIALGVPARVVKMRNAAS